MREREADPPRAAKDDKHKDLRELSPPAVAGLAVVCAAAGLLTIAASVRSLVDIWLTDDLKSMGLAVPFVSLLLVLRAWRGLGWTTEDEPRSYSYWWGFALLAGAAALVFVREQTLLIVTVNKDWLLQLPPLPLVAVVYAAGMVLLLGGRRLLRAAWFPVVFMWAVIPVPQTFSNRIDLPLQHASASVARAFAHALGQPLTEDKLRLMFTPEFGMFIAPGCNGIRGAITLGLAAVVVGYLFRFRWWVFAPVIAGAVLLGYLFNFLRLCLLVVYYKLALPYPWMQHHAKVADYVIGGCLFVAALGVFFVVAERLRRDGNGTEILRREADPPAFHPAARKDDTGRGAAGVSRPAGSYLLRVGAVLALAAVFGVDVLHQRALAGTAVAVPRALPDVLGNYRLVRTWQDTLADGIVVYTWGEYAPADPAGAHVSLGISPRLDVHDAEVCHIARGEEPVWHGQIEAASPGGAVAMSAAAYNDGRAQRLEASTVCDGGTCRQFSETSRHITLVYARPHRNSPLDADRTRPVPVLLKVATLDTVSPVAVTEPQMAMAVKDFLGQVDLVALTKAYARRQ